jgi:hypothetical protein
MEPPGSKEKALTGSSRPLPAKSESITHKKAGLKAGFQLPRSNPAYSDGKALLA